MDWQINLDMKLESTKVSLDKSAQEVFDFLTTVENFEHINAREHQ